MKPLAGIRVLDFTQRLPGPLATHILARAGADVQKIEPPGGDPLDRATPLWPNAPATYRALNAGKRIERVDLRDPGARERVASLAAAADVVVEGFRPGVMARFALDDETVRACNPRVVYCSLTGYGAHGPRRERAGHDLSYLAESGVLSLLTTALGEPVVPGALIADIGAGAYPVVINVALALLARERTGIGTHLDCAIARDLEPFALWARADGAAGDWPETRSHLFTGRFARYNVYRTADDKWLAVAAIEPQFWERFCEAVELDAALRHERDPEATRAGVAALVRSRDSRHWRALFQRVDACCAIVDRIEEAFAGPQRDAVSVPLAPAFLQDDEAP